MHYDPIKKTLGNIFNVSPFTRTIFYKLLDILLLRSWHIHREIKDWLKEKGTNQSMNILDAGFGFGQYTYYMTNKMPNAKILGVDVKDDQVRDCGSFFKALKKQNVSFEVADLTVYQSPAKYDMILCVDVMEHIEEDVQVFKNYYASLMNGGVLFISTPSDQGGSDVHDHDDESFIGEHVRDGYSISDMEEKLKKAGFHNISCKYAYGTYGSISWKISMKYPILMLNWSKIMMLILPFYFIITMPISLILNKLDVASNNKTGTGLIVKATK
jgi:SAM-dependent methyltransferase